MFIYEFLPLFLQQSLGSLDGKLQFKSKSVCLYLSWAAGLFSSANINWNKVTFLLGGVSFSRVWQVSIKNNNAVMLTEANL